MVTIKRSEKRQYLPILPGCRSAERLPMTLEITDLSAVFHKLRPIGTPLAFMNLSEVPKVRCTAAQGRFKPRSLS